MASASNIAAFSDFVLCEDNGYVVGGNGAGSDADADDSGGLNDIAGINNAKKAAARDAKAAKRATASPGNANNNAGNNNGNMVADPGSDEEDESSMRESDAKESAWWQLRMGDAHPGCIVGLKRLAGGAWRPDSIYYENEKLREFIDVAGHNITGKMAKTAAFGPAHGKNVADTPANWTVTAHAEVPTPGQPGREWQESGITLCNAKPIFEASLKAEADDEDERERLSDMMGPDDDPYEYEPESPTEGEKAVYALIDVSITNPLIKAANSGNTTSEGADTMSPINETNPVNQSSDYALGDHKWKVKLVANTDEGGTVHAHQPDVPGGSKGNIFVEHGPDGTVKSIRAYLKDDAGTLVDSKECSDMGQALDFIQIGLGMAEAAAPAPASGHNAEATSALVAGDPVTHDKAPFVDRPVGEVLRVEDGEIWVQLNDDVSDEDLAWLGITENIADVRKQPVWFELDEGLRRFAPGGSVQAVAESAGITEEPSADMVAGSLFHAARTGDSAAVLRISNSGRSLDMRDKNGQSPLHVAAAFAAGNTESVIDTLADDIDINVLDGAKQTPLDRAANSRVAAHIMKLGGKSADDLGVDSSELDKKVKVKDAPMAVAAAESAGINNVSEADTAEVDRIGRQYAGKLKGILADYVASGSAVNTDGVEALMDFADWIGVELNQIVEKFRVHFLQNHKGEPTEAAAKKYLDQVEQTQNHYYAAMNAAFPGSMDARIRKKYPSLASMSDVSKRPTESAGITEAKFAPGDSVSFSADGACGACAVTGVTESGKYVVEVRGKTNIETAMNALYRENAGDAYGAGGDVPAEIGIERRDNDTYLFTLPAESAEGFGQYLWPATATENTAPASNASAAPASTASNAVSEGSNTPTKPLTEQQRMRQTVSLIEGIVRSNSNAKVL